MYIYYRISDKGNLKEKLPNADKFSCILNAMKEFGRENFFIIADNCISTTIDFLKKEKLVYEETSLGNSGSFLYMIEQILRRNNPQDFVYLLEDDYIHLPGSRLVLEEGLAIADYVTLYDHPDKYKLYTHSGNPLNRNKLRPVTVCLTAHSHWKVTDSTTMTFAARVATIQSDLPVWKKYTKGRNPKDFHAFITLTQNSVHLAVSMLLIKKIRAFGIIIWNWTIRKKVRRLVSALPAYATHTELKWLAPVKNWKEI